MTLTPQDWRILRAPLLALGVALIAMGLLVAYTQAQEDTSEQAMQAQQNELNQARQRYQSSGLEKDTIVKYLPQYQRLIETGFIGEERRIEWIDVLRNIHQQQKLFSINYSIDPQEPYKPSFNLNTGAYTLHRSVMKLGLAMLHEGDIFTLLEALNAQESAPYILRQCEFTRLADSSKAKFSPTLQANCELDWLTLQEPMPAGAVHP